MELVRQWRKKLQEEVKMFKSLSVAVVVLCGLFFAGCASIPKWTTKGAGAFGNTEGKVFYGIGRAGADITDKALRIETADNRARADLQRVFDTYSASLMKDYSGTDGELVERAVKTFSAGHISGAQIVDHYTDADGMEYALLKLDLESFKKAMELAKDLNAQAKEYIRQKSDALFEQLGKEEDKREAK